MGRQVNFYMLEDDEKEFVNFVLQTGNVVIASYTSQTEEPNIITELPNLLNEEFTSVSLINLDFDNMIKTEYIDTQDYFIVDRENSTVIEFFRSFLENNRLLRGRIWAEMTYLKDGKLFYKGEEFERWYNKIARWIRRRYKKLDPGIYIGPKASEWWQREGNLLYDGVLTYAYPSYIPLEWQKETDVMGSV